MLELHAMERCNCTRGVMSRVIVASVLEQPKNHCLKNITLQAHAVDALYAQHGNDLNVAWPSGPGLPAKSL